jgi:hypothetical protein
MVELGVAQDVVSLTLCMKATAAAGDARAALRLFDEMLALSGPGCAATSLLGKAQAKPQLESDSSTGWRTQVWQQEPGAFSGPASEEQLEPAGVVMPKRSPSITSSGTGGTMSAIGGLADGTAVAAVHSTNPAVRAAAARAATARAASIAAAQEAGRVAADAASGPDVVAWNALVGHMIVVLCCEGRRTHHQQLHT